MVHLPVVDEEVDISLPMYCFFVGEDVRVKTKWLNCISYQNGLKLQQDFIEQSKDTGLCYLLGLEHEPVITLGLGAKEEDILAPSHVLKQKGVEIIWTKRGGKVTCHSPGQLVIYPIVPFKKLQITVREYVYLLEDITRVFLENLGISCLPKNIKRPAAIYTQKGKIAFFGLQIQKNIACHGLAINISNDLSFFSLIRPCGIDSEEVDSVSHYYKIKPSSLLLERWSHLFHQHIHQLHTQ